MRLINSKRFSIRLAHGLAICSVLAIAACGGGDNSGSSGSGTGDGGGSDLAASQDQIPGAARRDGKSFVAWMATWVTSTDGTGEPVTISTNPIPPDESAEPDPV